MTAGTRPAFDVSVVIVTYRRPDLVRRCLASLENAETDLDLEIVVVDNHGSDGTAELVRSEFPDAVLLEPGENLGFARACNLGVAAASSELLLMLNPDTEVTDHAIDAMVEFDRLHHGAGLVGGRTVSGDGELDPSSCFGRMTLWSLFCFASGLSAAFSGSGVFDPVSLGNWQRDTVREVGVVTGCLLLARRSVWQTLGGFDEDYFMYAEDADLSWRAWSAGYRPAITPEATIVHHLGASSTDTASRLVMRNTGVSTYIRKRWRPPWRQLALAMFAMGVLVRSVGYGIAARLAPGLAPEAEKWAEVWRLRNSWLPGYPLSSGSGAAQ